MEELYVEARVRLEEEFGAEEEGLKCRAEEQVFFWTGLRRDRTEDVMNDPICVGCISTSFELELNRVSGQRHSRPL